MELALLYALSANMKITYRVQRGKLNGSFKTCYSTNSEAAAKRAYGATQIKDGEKKRLQEIKVFTVGESVKRTILKDMGYAT